MSDSLWPHELQHTRPPCPSPTPRVHPNSCASSRWCHPAISSSVVPFSSCPQSLQHQGLFQWVNSSHEVAKVLEFQLQHQSFQWTPRSSEVMEFQLSYFKSWKMMLWKCCTQYASKLGKLSSGHRTRKGQFSFQYTYLAVHNFLKRDWTPCIVYSFIFHLTIYLCPYMWFVIIVFLCRCGLWGSKYVCMCICVYRCLCTYVCVCVCVCVQLFSSRIYSWKFNCWVKKNGYLTYMHCYV